MDLRPTWLEEKVLPGVGDKVPNRWAMATQFYGHRPPLWGGFGMRRALAAICLAIRAHFRIEMVKLARTNPLHQLFQHLRPIRIRQRLNGLEHLLADRLIRGVGT